MEYEEIRELEENLKNGQEDIDSNPLQQLANKSMSKELDNLNQNEN